MLAHPGVARRPCRVCAEYQFHDADEVGGPLVVRPARGPGGVPQRRPPGQPPPCERCPKILPGDPPFPENASGWTEDRHHAAWRFWKECKAVGIFPDDPLVRRHAALFEETLTRLADLRHGRVEQLLVTVATLASTLGGGHGR